MLAARSVSKAFGGHRAVDGVSLSVERGTITGLIGPNGAGKTTLFNCIAGALPLSSGEIELDGRRIDNIGADRIFSRGLARTFQIPRPFPDMSVLENVMLALPKQSGELFYMNWLAPRRVAREEQAAKASARRWIDFVGLSHLQHDPARVLSGGQRKLLELARVLVAEPKLILLDEPAAGVNPALLDVIIEKIVALNQQGVTFLIIEHNMDMVLSLCHPLHVLAEGKLLMSGAAADVRGDPRVIDAYLGGAAT